MSGTESPFSLVKAHNTETERRDISRNRSVGTRSRKVTTSESSTRSKTPYRETAKTTLRAKIGSGRSPTPKRATCMKKSETGKENAGNKNENSRLKVTRLAYSKNPTMNPILSRLSKLNMETITSASKNSTIPSSNSQSGRESELVDETSQITDKNIDENETIQAIEEIDSLDDSDQKILSSQNILFNLNNQSATNQGTSTNLAMNQILSEPKIHEQSQPDSSQTSINIPAPQTQQSDSESKPTCSQLDGCRESTVTTSGLCVVSHPARVQAALHTPTFSAHHTPTLRREVRECRACQEPKNEENASPLVTRVDVMQPCTSTYADVNVVTIPSDTYAACQAAFTYAAVSVAETLDNVLVQLQVPSTSDGGVAHVSKVVVPGANSHHMTSALSMMHSTGSNTSINSESSITESTASTSSASESEWDDGPKAAEEPYETNRRDRGSRSSKLSRPSLTWEVNDDDEKLRSPEEQ